MNYQEVLKNARQNIGPYCKVCPECNGVACRGQIPGPGGKGTGLGFIRSYQDLKKIRLQMDTIYEPKSVSTQTVLFGKTFEIPVFAAPIGAVALHYSPLYDDISYSTEVLEGCKMAGSVAFTGDGVNEEVFLGTLESLSKLEGWGIPTIKPWSLNEVIRKATLSEKAGAIAVAMDIDAAGLTVLATLGKPVAPMSEFTLRKIVDSIKIPFIVKGVMTVAGAKKALEAGASGIVISNHGGRVLDETPSTIEVLPEIAAEVGGRMTILIDGAFRTGIDVFKALALGADGVLIGRPFAYAVYGGGALGVSLYLEKLKAELIEAMIMTGAGSIEEIDLSKVTVQLGR